MSLSLSQKSFDGALCLTMKKRSLTALIIFIVGFLWMFLLIQGLPIGDHDDWDHLVAAKEAPRNEILLNLLSPWSRSAFWHGRGDLFDQVLHERVFFTLTLKSIEKIFGFTPFPFYFFYKALFFPSVLVLVFLLLEDLTHSTRFSVAGCLLYAFFPVHYMHLFWICDFIAMVHFFMLAAIYLFIRMWRNLDEEKSFEEFRRLLVPFLFLGWLAMKSKVPALVLPLSVGLSALTRLNHWKKQKGKLSLLFGVLALLVLTVVPLEHLQDAKRAPSSFHWENVRRMALRNYANQYEDEPRSAFFSTESVIPVSMARNLGFFVLWNAVLFLLIYLIRWRGSEKKKKSQYFFAPPLARLSLIWMVMETLCMGMFDADPRYFSGTLIPVTFLLVHLTHGVYQTFLSPWNKRWMILPTASLIANLVFNFPHILFLRTHIGARYEQIFNSTKIIYHDQFPDKPLDSYPLALYGCLHCVPPESSKHPRLKNVIYYSDLGPKSWNKSETGALEDWKRYREGGAVYYVSFRKEFLVATPGLKSLATVPGYNPRSLFYQLYLKNKRKKPTPLYILKWDL